MIVATNFSGDSLEENSRWMPTKQSTGLTKHSRDVATGNTMKHLNIKKYPKRYPKRCHNPVTLMENKLDRVNTSVSKRSHKIQLGITKPYPGYGNTTRPFRLRFQPSFLLMTLFSALIMTSKFQRYAIVNTSWKPSIPRTSKRCTCDWLSMILQFFFLQINIYQYCVCMLTPMYFLKNRTDSIIPLQLQASWQRVTWTTYTLDSERLEPKDMVLRQEEYNPYIYIYTCAMHQFWNSMSVFKHDISQDMLPNRRDLWVTGLVQIDALLPWIKAMLRDVLSLTSLTWKCFTDGFVWMSLFWGKYPGRWKMAPKIIFILENDVSSHDLFWSANSVKS